MGAVTSLPVGKTFQECVALLKKYSIRNPETICRGASSSSSTSSPHPHPPHPSSSISPHPTAPPTLDQAFWSKVILGAVGGCVAVWGIKEVICWYRRRSALRRADLEALWRSGRLVVVDEPPSTIHSMAQNPRLQRAPAWPSVSYSRRHLLASDSGSRRPSTSTIAEEEEGGRDEEGRQREEGQREEQGEEP